MPQTYRAIIEDDRIVWKDDVHPDTIRRALEVQVTVPADSPQVSDWPARRERALAAMRRIAQRGGLEGIGDPVAWQREVREDRPLPGRES